MTLLTSDKNYEIPISSIYSREEIISKDLKAWLSEHSEVTTYVTPEMFGAKGDGVTDDTDAIQKCMDSNEVLVMFSYKPYKITNTIKVTKDKSIFGGVFFMPSSDNRISLFSINDTKHFEITDSIFSSIRDNTNVYPPKGHTRVSDSLSSNITFVKCNNVNNVFINNTSFFNSEYDLALDNCETVNIDKFSSLNASMHVYATGNKNLNWNNGTVKLYDKLGNGDHHFYICYGNDDFKVSNVKMESGTNSRSYPIHVYAEEDQRNANGGYTKRAVINNCDITADTMFAACVEEFFEVNNTTINYLGNDACQLIFTGNNNEAKYRINGITVNGRMLIGKISNGNIDISNSNFEEDLIFNTNSKVNIINSNIHKGLRVILVGKLSVTNSSISNSSYAVYMENNDNVKFEVVLNKCHMVSNCNDGFVSVRGPMSLTLSYCYGENDASEYINYNTSESTATINMYNCNFPNHKIRTSDVNTTFNLENNTFSE